MPKMQHAVASLLILGAVSGVRAHQHDLPVGLEGGAGVSPVSSFAELFVRLPNPNGTFPNVTRNLVRVVSDERMRATVICEAPDPFAGRSPADSTDEMTFEGAVPLEPTGEFRIDDTQKAPGHIGDPVPPRCSPLLPIQK